MKMLYIGIGIAVVVALVLAIRNSHIRNFIDRIFIPKSVAGYPSIQNGTFNAGDYELVRMLEGEVNDLYWDAVGGNVMAIRAFRADVDAAGYAWKITPQGTLLDSLKLPWRELGYLYLYEQMLLETGYVDWIRTGDKVIKPYRDSTERDQLYAQRGLGGEGPGKLPELENQIGYFRNWRDQSHDLVLTHFVREKRQSKSFYDINNTSRGGWNGTGYFRLRYDSATFYFKAYTFKGSYGYEPDIDVYELPSEDGEKHGLLINIRKPRISKRDYSEAGLYVLRRVQE